MRRQQQADTFGARVATLRRNRKLSQEGLAERAGISRPYVARLETGVQDPSLSTLRKLAAALDVPIADLTTEGTMTMRPGKGGYKDRTKTINELSLPEAKAALANSTRRANDLRRRIQELKAAAKGGG